MDSQDFVRNRIKCFSRKISRIYSPYGNESRLVDQQDLWHIFNWYESNANLITQWKFSLSYGIDEESFLNSKIFH